MRDIDTDQPIRILRRWGSDRPVQAFRPGTGWVDFLEAERYFVKGDLNDDDEVSAEEAHHIAARYMA